MIGMGAETRDRGEIGSWLGVRGRGTGSGTRSLLLLGPELGVPASGT